MAAIPLPPTASLDEIPYSTGSHPQTHPNRLAGMAHLFGVAAASPATARVLELGCGDGTNLLPMADQYRGATFLGIDGSEGLIVAGKKAAEAGGLKNVELRHQDILQFPESAGKFDFIIVHDLFSVVPPAVRKKILTICQAHLADQGVAYISYNALPGWNMRRSLRDMMLYHTQAFPDAQAKVQQARALLAFLAESVPTENNAYGMLLKSELELMRTQPDNYIRQDILEDNNTPCYFHDFMTVAAQHGLQYLGEGSLLEMLASNFPEKVRDTLGQISNNIVRQEQYMDFLRNRAYRQTLLCRTGVEIRRALAPDALRKLAFRSLLRSPEKATDYAPGVPATFTSALNLTLTTTDGFLKAVLHSLAETAGNSVISYQQLLDISRLRSRSAMTEVPSNRDKLDEDNLGANLLNLLAKGFLEVWAEPVAVDARVPEKPAASALVRYQAANARFITNRVHQPLPGDVLGRYIVELCNGTRTRDDILGAVITFSKQDKIAIKEGDQRITDIQRLREVLRPQVDGVLTRMAAAGFFS